MIDAPNHIKMFKRLSIATNGDTITITQSARSLSEVLKQELDYYAGVKKNLAQVNITQENYA